VCVCVCVCVCVRGVRVCRQEYLGKKRKENPSVSRNPHSNLSFPTPAFSIAFQRFTRFTIRRIPSPLRFATFPPPPPPPTNTTHTYRHTAHATSTPPPHWQIPSPPYCPLIHCPPLEEGECTKPGGMAGDSVTLNGFLSEKLANSCNSCNGEPERAKKRTTVNATFLTEGKWR
jgi:hypothetical protein